MSQGSHKSRSSTKRGKSQVQCASCSQFLHLWNRHAICIRCSRKEGRLCAPDRPCQVCESWSDDLWTLYLSAAKEPVKTPPQARRRLLSPSSAPATGFQPGFTGRLPGPGHSSTFPGSYSFAGSPWHPHPPSANWELERYRTHLLQQLATLPPQGGPDFLSQDQLDMGLRDADMLLPPGQIPRSSSPSSSRSSRDLLGFQPLNNSFEQADDTSLRGSSGGKPGKEPLLSSDLLSNQRSKKRTRSTSSRGRQLVSITRLHSGQVVKLYL